MCVFSMYVSATMLRETLSALIMPARSNIIPAHRTTPRCNTLQRSNIDDPSHNNIIPATDYNRLQ